MSWPVTHSPKGATLLTLAPFAQTSLSGIATADLGMHMQEIDHAEALTRVIASSTPQQQRQAASLQKSDATENWFAGPARQLCATQPQQPEGAHV